MIYYDYNVFNVRKEGNKLIGDLIPVDKYDEITERERRMKDPEYSFKRILEGCARKIGPRIGNIIVKL